MTMTWERLYQRAYELAISFKNEVILYDLLLMNEAELLGVINYLVRLQRC